MGADGVRDGRRILALPHKSGAERIAQLRRLAELARRTDDRLSTLRFGPRRGLVWPMARAHRELVGDVVDLRRGLIRGSAAADAVVGLLTGPRTYLVFAANNAEMRAGSGMFLSVGQFITRDGSVRLTGMGTVNDVAIPPGAVPLQGDLAGRWGWLKPQNDWRNLMVSPRFDVSAALATKMWAAAGRGPVDGVISFDPVALQKILEATGPVTLGARSIGPREILPELLHDQYIRFPREVQLPERREELSAIATAAVAALEGGNWSPAQLADRLAKAARQRHILVWSARPDEERAWEAAGAAGSVGPNSLLVAVVNRGANKLDQYLPVRARLELHPAGDHTDGAVRITLDNTTPPGEPFYIAGALPASRLAAGEYLGILAVTLPEGARGGRFDGVSELAVAGPDGPSRVIGVEVRLTPGSQRTFVARFRLPGRHGAVRVESSARVPVERWDAPGGAWADGSARTVRW